MTHTDGSGDRSELGHPGPGGPQATTPLLSPMHF